jgi:ribosomal protein L37AE/L43A
LPLSTPNKESQMRCPGCKRFSLKRKDEGVSCNTCGYTLTPGEESRYRLYELLK